MKNKKFVWGLILITICIICGAVCFLLFNKTKTSAEYNIKIHEDWNDPVAGERRYGNRTLFIDSNKCIGKITYHDVMDNEFKETEEFKISKEDIKKILELAENGEPTKNVENGEAYTIYEIELNDKTIYVDSKLDKENIISNLFIDEKF